jgi:hypothetical protein
MGRVAWNKAEPDKNTLFERDNYACKECGCKKRKLNAHHILPFCDPMYDEFKFDDRNGITLCEECHRKLHIFNRRKAA